MEQLVIPSYLFYFHPSKNIYFYVSEAKYLEKFPEKFPPGSVILLENTEIINKNYPHTTFIYVNTGFEKIPPHELKVQVINLYAKIITRLDIFINKSKVNDL